MKFSKLPAGAGVGFKPEHFAEINAEPQPLAFFEVHAENYMGAGGPPHAQLSRLRQDYALSIHGVGLSIGAMQPLDRAHPTEVHDIYATVLHLLGIDHTRLSVRHDGIDRRLTDVHGHVIRPILA